MTIILNGNELDITFENEKTVGEALGLIELECKKERMTITEVKADGRAVNAAELDNIFLQSIDADITLELLAVSGADIRGFVHNMGTTFSVYAESIEALPMYLQEGKDKQVIEDLQQFSYQLQELYRALSLSDITGLSSDLPINGQPFGEFQKGLSNFLNELVTALEEKDSIAASDIAEYELAPLVKELANTLLSIV